MKRLLPLLPLLGLVACNPSKIIIKSGFEEGTIALHRSSKLMAAKQDDMFAFYIKQKERSIDIHSQYGYWRAVDDAEKKLKTLKYWQQKLPKGFVQFKVIISLIYPNGETQTTYGLTGEDGTKNRVVSCLDPSLTKEQRAEIVEATKTDNPSKDFELSIFQKGSRLHSQGRPLLMDRMIDKACELYANH